MAVWVSVRRSLILSSFGRLDAEYYHPSNLQAYAKIVNQSHTFVTNVAKAGYRVVYGNTKLTPQSLATPDMPLFVQASNINAADGEIEFANCGCTVASDWYNYPRGRIKKGELLIEVKGQAEKVSIVPNDAPEKTLISGSLFKLEVDERKISPWFVYIYFCTKYGRVLRDRVKTNTLIGFVSKPQLYAIPIVVPKANFQAEIEKMVKDSFMLRLKSRELYTSACSLLSSALKEKELKFDRPLSYTTRFSDVMRERRADADYFQVPYMQVQKHLNQIKCVPLSSLVDFAKGVEVGSDMYTETGTLFMRVSNLTERGMKFNASDKHIPEGLYRMLAGAFQPKQGELLLTKDGTPGVCWVVDRSIECIVSGAIVRLLPKGNDVSPEYLALAINSSLCRMQIEQQASGALILHWKLPLIKKLRIPLCNEETMKEISRLVKESKRRQYESESLLAAAKAKVEELIESAAK